jgi:hypothetical protein
MPRQIFDAKSFRKLLEKAEEVRVVKREGYVKVKARLKRQLYTYVTDQNEAEKLLKIVKAPIKEF